MNPGFNIHLRASQQGLVQSWQLSEMKDQKCFVLWPLFKEFIYCVSVELSLSCFSESNLNAWSLTMICVSRVLLTTSVWDFYFVSFPWSCSVLHSEWILPSPKFVTFLAPGASFIEDAFSIDWQFEGWFQDDLSALYLLYLPWYNGRWSSGGNVNNGSSCK